MNGETRIETLLAECERALLASSVCLRCGASGTPRRVRPPSGAVELLLWGIGALLVLLGEFTVLALAPCYSVWRRSATRPACASCDAHGTLVPGTSPKGRAELASQGLLR